MDRFVSPFVIRPSSSPRRRSAFTLIELLVVVAIITILIAILVPSLSKAREYTRTTVCQTRLRAWAQGFHVYAAGNSNLLPLDGDSNNEATPIGRWDDLGLWINAIPSVTNNNTYDELQHGQPGFADPATPAPHKGLPVAGINSLFVCPSAINVGPGTGDNVVGGYFQTVGYTDSFALQTRDMLLCYGMNSQLRNWTYGTSKATYPGAPKTGDTSRLTSIPNPTTTVLVVEKRVSPTELSGISSADLNGAKSTQTLTQTKVAPKRFTARHTQGGNIGFADAHVEWFAFKTVDAANNYPDASHSFAQYEQPNILIWNPNDIP